MKFTKMHGLGNDYVYVNCFEEKIENPAEIAIEVSDRHTGIGSDGLILVCPSEKADVRMRMFNADGSEAEMCGNGIRCVAKYTYEHALAQGGDPFNVPGVGICGNTSLAIETGKGILTVGLTLDETNNVSSVCVNMGQPILKPELVPVQMPGDDVIDAEIEILGETLQMTAVSMGNPHAVFFCDDVNDIELEKLGSEIENHPAFPNRTNVHFVQIQDKGEFIMRTWERGSGITLACGTGACACCVAAVLTGRTGRTCTAHLPGGTLELNWSETDNCVYMTGPAVEVFNGTWQM